MKIKTIDVNVKVWHDRVDENYYFAGTVTINCGMKTEKECNIPMNWGGGGDFYIQRAGEILNDNKVIADRADAKYLWLYCRDNKIILRTNKQENCKKRELKEYNN